MSFQIILLVQHFTNLTGQNSLTDNILKKITQDVWGRCSVIMCNHNVQFARHSQNLVRLCLMTTCYFQHYISVLSHNDCFEIKPIKHCINTNEKQHTSYSTTTTTTHWSAVLQVFLVNGYTWREKVWKLDLWQGCHGYILSLTSFANHLSMATTPQPSIGKLSWISYSLPCNDLFNNKQYTTLADAVQ